MPKARHRQVSSDRLVFPVAFLGRGEAFQVPLALQELQVASVLVLTSAYEVCASGSVPEKGPSPGRRSFQVSGVAISDHCLEKLARIFFGARNRRKAEFDVQTFQLEASEELVKLLADDIYA